MFNSLLQRNELGRTRRLSENKYLFVISTLRNLNMNVLLQNIAICRCVCLGKCTIEQILFCSEMCKVNLDSKRIRIDFHCTRSHVSSSLDTITYFRWIIHFPMGWIIHLFTSPYFVGISWGFTGNSSQYKREELSGEQRWLICERPGCLWCPWLREHNMRSNNKEQQEWTQELEIND